MSQKPDVPYARLDPEKAMEEPLKPRKLSEWLNEIPYGLDTIWVMDEDQRCAIVRSDPHSKNPQEQSSAHPMVVMNGGKEYVRIHTGEKPQTSISSMFPNIPYKFVMLGSAPTLVPYLEEEDDLNYEVCSVTDNFCHQVGIHSMKSRTRFYQCVFVLTVFLVLLLLAGNIVWPVLYFTGTEPDDPSKIHRMDTEPPKYYFAAGKDDEDSFA